MIEVVFKYELDEDLGEMGWIPETQPDFNANTSPDSIAHDVLDHHDLRDGSIEGEMRAFGAMLCSRGETGHMESRDPYHRSAEWLMGYAMGSVLRDKWASGYPDLAIPKNAGQRLLNDEAEWLLEATVHTAIKALREETYHCRPAEKDDLESFIVACQEALPRYMRIGYRQVQRRFRADGLAIAFLYDQIVNDKGIKLACEGEQQPQSRLVIKIEPRTLKFDANIEHWRDPYA